MVGVGTHAVPGQFSVDFGAARFSVFVFFQHHNARPFRQHKSVALTIPGPTRPSGIVIASRQRFHIAKPTHRKRRDGTLGAPCHHDIGIAILNQPRGFADGMRAGGAGRHHRQIRPFESVHDRQMAGNHIADG